jgi:hypothetical protein
LHRFATAEEIKRASFDDRFSKPDTQVSGFFLWASFLYLVSACSLNDDLFGAVQI